MLNDFERGILENLAHLPFEADRGAGFYTDLMRRGLVKSEPGPSYPGAPTRVRFMSITDAGLKAIRPPQRKRP